MVPGELIECTIQVPTHQSDDPHGVIYLKCRAMTVRVEKIEGCNQFGFACRIEDYTVVGAAGPLLLL